MILKAISSRLVSRAEKRLGVKLEYAHEIAKTNFGLMKRFGKVFGFLDPNKNTSALAYHTARLRGAMATDCGTCVESEMNLAKHAGVSSEIILAILCGDYSELPKAVSAVARLSDAVVGRREDAPDARDIVKQEFGDAGLIEICYAMNGAALLPGIKRAMGHATSCNLEVMRLKS